jgi:uncharacterized protein YrrD
MLRPISELAGYAVGATDGPIGSIVDYLFDDATWRVRWLVADTGSWLFGRHVLLPPSILGHVNHIGHQFAVRLTQQQVRESPDVKTDEPVSRLMENNLYDHYGWTPYWSSGFYLSGYGYTGAQTPPGDPSSAPRETEDQVAQRLGSDPHLRSARELAGYHIHARDGDIGHVADFIIEDGDWSLRYLVVETGHWWPGKRVLISPRSILSVDWAGRSIDLSVDRRGVSQSPAYIAAELINRAYERDFHQYYDRLTLAEVA